MSPWSWAGKASRAPAENLQRALWSLGGAPNPASPRGRTRCPRTCRVAGRHPSSGRSWVAGNESSAQSLNKRKMRVSMPAPPTGRQRRETVHVQHVGGGTASPARTGDPQIHNLVIVFDFNGISANWHRFPSCLRPQLRTALKAIIEATVVNVRHRARRSTSGAPGSRC